GVGVPARVLDDALDPRLHLGHGRPPVGVVLGALHAQLQQPHHLPLGARLVADGGVEHLRRPLLLHHRPHPPRQVDGGAAVRRRVERRPAAEQLEQQHAEAVHVGALRHAPRVDHLRRAVPRAPLRSRRRRRAADELGQAVVGDVGGVPCRGDDDVGRLDVAVR
ncbi:Os08g0427550, partial [Oryza sativa Japonica Group]